MREGSYYLKQFLVMLEFCIVFGDHLKLPWASRSIEVVTVVSGEFVFFLKQSHSATQASIECIM